MCHIIIIDKKKKNKNFVIVISESFFIVTSSILEYRILEFICIVNNTLKVNEIIIIIILKFDFIIFRLTINITSEQKFMKGGIPRFNSIKTNNIKAIFLTPDSKDLKNIVLRFSHIS